MAKVVPNGDIAGNTYNLSVSQYVEKEDNREEIDIKVLNTEIEEIVAREEELRVELRKIIDEIEGAESNRDCRLSYSFCM